MKSCFGYVRVSTEKQGEGVSLEAQREAILRFADKSDLRVCKWFEEKQTAAKSGRPVFSAMLKLLRARKADGVIMHKIDRSARNFRDWAQIGELSDAGIDVHFATESLDFRSRGGRLSADIQAVIAADYIRNLREEVHKGIEGRLRQGLYPFKAPLGYCDNGGGKVKTLDPDRALLVKHAFELYASGTHSLRSLIKEMAHLGLRNEFGKPLTKTGLETLLGNPFYCGIIRVKRTGRVYQGIQEPLIPVSLFDRVQEVRAGKAGKKVTRHNHTYRGLFRCALCSGAMVPELQKGHIYYRCQKPDCPTKCVREEAIEDAVLAMLSRLRLSDAHVTQLCAEIEAWCGKRAQCTEKPGALQLAQIETRLNRLTDALIDRLIEEHAFHRRKQALLLDKARIEEARADAELRQAEPGRVKKFLELVKNLAATYVSAIAEEKRQMVEWATSNRLIAGKNTILEPAKWLLATEKAIAGLIGEQHRPTYRRRREVRKTELIKSLIAISGLEGARNPPEVLLTKNNYATDKKERKPFRRHDSATVAK